MTHPAGTGSGSGIAALHRLVGLSPPTLDRPGFVEATGADTEEARRWWRALGFAEAPDGDVIFGDDDIEMVRRLTLLVATGLIDDSDVLRLARLTGTMFSRLAEAQVATVDDILSSLPGASETDSPRERLRALVRSGSSNVLLTFEDSVIYVWRRHLLAAIGRWLGAESETTDAAVGFGDLARFTRISGRLDRDELAHLIDRFEAVSFDVVNAAGARVVKLIGDEVMFVAPTLATAARIGLELVDRLAEVPDMPEVRCGIAFGPTVSVGGDVFGATVNLASRLTVAARPGAVMVRRTEAASLAGVEGIQVRQVRRRLDLDGIGRVHVCAIRRAEPGEPVGPDLAYEPGELVEAPYDG